jgi:hypothetical protein
MSGSVVYESNQRRLRAWPGLRLQSVGESLETGNNGTATLIVDTAIGFVHVTENTKFSIKTLDRLEDGSKITQLQVLQGQVRLRIRPLTNSKSKLEIHTPTGIVGVRGTEFGVSVQADGRTGVSTLTGRVEASAQNVTTLVAEKQQSLINPQEAPQLSSPLNNNPELRLENTIKTDSAVRLIGQVDPTHLLTIEGAVQATDRDGSFNLLIPTMEQSMLSVHIITPLGNKRKYSLPLR